MMISLSMGMTEQYRRTPFGVLVMRDYQESAGRLQRFRERAGSELAKLRQAQGNKDRKALLDADNALAVYVRYYKKFKKTYHVLPQIESVLNGKNLPDALGLIQVLLLVELTTSLLIAGHDLQHLTLPLTIDVSQGKEHYLAAGGREVQPKKNDICLKDRDGIILSIIYGQDEKSRITDATRDVLFFIDGVPGIKREVVDAGLDQLVSLLFLLSPDARIEYHFVIEA
ncbi:phenylalanine--tRNA ligase beta subunit-related protein [Acerihabitans arboris]|uniref:B3/B4 tRNA-binding domain-containing protein n=1 Tax=Acerihabitans arboris TaxID=2691583 RepID=A0A845ST82_9GAMM|nr:phenylalanine--tRNA ligase beta subunit-related protein [Acerihabitans arboris]NDL66036.1 hypothetical protein [Acerihabitans arboris]